MTDVLKGHDALDSTTVQHPIEDVFLGNALKEETVDNFVVGIPQVCNANYIK